MIETHLNIFDAVVIGILGLSCLFAFFRGIVREILSLGAWIGAALVTMYFFPMVGDKLEPHFHNAKVAAGVGTLGIYVTALIGFSIINMLLLKFIKSGAEVGMLDNTLGLFFGLFRGALIISLGYFLITMTSLEKENPDWLRQSVTRPYVERGAVMLKNVAPQYLAELSKLGNEASSEIDTGTNSGRAPVFYGEGDSATTTRQLDRVLDQK
jgi:membrane protein required for colicin V production